MDSGEGEALVRRRPLAAIRTGRRRDHEMREEEEEEEPMSPAARLFHEPHFNCHILAIMGSGKPIDVPVAKAGIRATLARHPRFASVQVLDAAAGGKKARWVRAEVDVDKHLVIPDLHPDGGGGAADKLMEDYVAALTRSPMDHSRPLWEFHILNFPTSEAAATAVLRVHHSLGDGTSLMSLLLACFRKTSDPDALPTLHGTEPAPPPADPGGCGRRRSAFALLRRAWALPVLLWNTAVDAASFAATAVFLKDSETPLKGAEGTEFRPKRFVHRSVSLDDIKAIKNAMHCKINDALLGVSAAGFSRYLTRKYGEEGKKLPENLRMRSTLLVNMRPAPTINAMANMMEDGKSGDGKGWGNMLGYLLLPFPVAAYEDPLDYVRKGKEIADRKKNSLEAVFTFKSAEIFFKLFGLKAAGAFSRRILANTTLSFSNIVGPSEEIEINGHPLVFLAPTAYGHPHALTVNFFSYMNTMRIVLAVDESTIPDPHQLLDDLVAGLNLIKESIPH